MIVAVDEKMGLGKDGAIPWRSSRDMRRFKDVTLRPSGEGKQNVVVMGRKTWESLPDKFRPLPGRLNIVISSRSGLSLPEGVIQVNVFDQALAKAADRDDTGEVFVIGGGIVFSEAIERKECHNLYLTHIAGDFSCDVFFPRIPDDFMMVNMSETIEEGSLTFRFCEYQRNRTAQ